MKFKKFICRLWIIQIILFGYFIYRFVDSGSILDRIVFQFDASYKDLVFSRSDSLLNSSLYASNLGLTNPNQYGGVTDYHHVEISDDIAISYTIYDPDSTNNIMAISLMSYQLSREDFARDHFFNRIDWGGSILSQNKACRQFKQTMLDGVHYTQNHSDLMINYNYFRYAFVMFTGISTGLLCITSVLAIWSLVRREEDE